MIGLGQTAAQQAEGNYWLERVYTEALRSAINRVEISPKSTEVKKTNLLLLLEDI